MSAFKLTTTVDKEVLPLEDLHLSGDNRAKINQLVEEFMFVDVLQQFDLPVDNKILLYGHTGCGKTATAYAIAKQLDKKMITLHLGGFVSSRLGETAKNMTEVFRRARLDKAILFIDEFDFIGKSREEDSKDTGEMRRIVNTLLQLIDALHPEVLLIGATNFLEIIDVALLRRFQLKLRYDLPTDAELNVYYDALLDKFPKLYSSIDRKFGISYAEAKDYTFQQVKRMVIQEEKRKRGLL